MSGIFLMRDRCAIGRPEGDLTEAGGGPGEQSPEGRPSEAGPWMDEEWSLHRQQSRPEGGAAWRARRTLASPPQAQSLKGPWMALQA